MIRAKKTQYQENLLNARIESAATAPWKLFQQKKSPHPSLVTPEQWAQHFSSLYNPSNEMPTFEAGLSTPEDETENYWYNVPFTAHEVKHLVENTPNHKAPGPDRLVYEHLRSALPLILLLLTNLFNLCLSMMKVPRTWKESILKALYKGKGDSTSPDSYRGIALLNVPLKLLTALINDRLRRNIIHQIPEEQHGFMQGKSTRTPVKKLIDYAKQELLRPKGHLYILVIDFRKAFDLVDRPLLLTKLRRRFGVKGKLLGLIKDLIAWNEFTVYDGVTHSDPIRQHRGVQQGDSLSPSLFILFITDLADVLRAIGRVIFSFFCRRLGSLLH